jgi:hypothetical protein
MLKGGIAAITMSLPNARVAYFTTPYHEKLASCFKSVITGFNPRRASTWERSVLSHCKTSILTEVLTNRNPKRVEGVFLFNYIVDLMLSVCVPRLSLVPMSVNSLYTPPPSQTAIPILVVVDYTPVFESYTLNFCYLYSVDIYCASNTPDTRPHSLRSAYRHPVPVTSSALTVTCKCRDTTQHYDGYCRRQFICNAFRQLALLLSQGGGS